MLPKVIHYCWFGGNPLGEKEIKCINSWKKFCPGYEIKRWDESNFDINCNNYVKEAYEEKKWAFVSDYARCKIIFEEGGLYFDTDVELIRSIDDIIQRGPFMGFEKKEMNGANHSVAVNLGLGIGAEKEMLIYKEILDSYAEKHFRLIDGSLNQTTIVDTVTNILVPHGLKLIPKNQKICDVYIYKDEYFSPMDYRTGKLTITPNTRSIHHYAGSWCSEEDIRVQEVQYRLVRKFGDRAGVIMGNCYGVLMRFKKRVKEKGMWKTINHYLRLFQK